MITIQWQGIVAVTLIVWLIYLAVQGLVKLYTYIYTAGYQLGKKNMETEDTNTLLKAIAELKEDYPNSEEVLVALYAKLTGQEVKKAKEGKPCGPIGFTK